MKIYERIYDNPVDEQGNKKPNKLLGEFELIEGKMDDYSYDVVVKKDNELYTLQGREVSGFYHKGLGGTKHFLQKLTDNKFVKAYLKFK